MSLEDSFQGHHVYKLIRMGNQILSFPSLIHRFLLISRVRKTCLYIIKYYPKLTEIKVREDPEGAGGEGGGRGDRDGEYM